MTLPSPEAKTGTERGITFGMKRTTHQMRLQRDLDSWGLGSRLHFSRFRPRSSNGQMRWTIPILGTRSPHCKSLRDERALSRLTNPSLLQPFAGRLTCKTVKNRGRQNKIIGDKLLRGSTSSGVRYLYSERLRCYWRLWVPCPRDDNAS